MNQEQQNFYDFTMKRVKSGREDEAKKILMEVFQKQDDGTFTKEYADKTAPKLLSHIKIQCVPEFIKVATDMGSKLK